MINTDHVKRAFSVYLLLTELSFVYIQNHAVLSAPSMKYMQCKLQIWL